MCLALQALVSKILWAFSSDLRATPQVQAAAPVGDGSRIVDILLTWPGGRVAVEVDGPSHFLRDASGARTILDTPTRMRNHILEQWGFTVVSVRLEDWPYRTWESAEFRQSLAARLRAAGVPLPPHSSSSRQTCAQSGVA
jgi:RAP domain